MHRLAPLNRLNFFKNDGGFFGGMFVDEFGTLYPHPPNIISDLVSTMIVFYTACHVLWRLLYAGVEFFRLKERLTRRVMALVEPVKRSTEPTLEFDNVSNILMWYVCAPGDHDSVACLIFKVFQVATVPSRPQRKPSPAASYLGDYCDAAASRVCHHCECHCVFLHGTNAKHEQWHVDTHLLVVPCGFDCRLVSHVSNIVESCFLFVILTFFFVHALTLFRFLGAATNRYVSHFRSYQLPQWMLSIRIRLARTRDALARGDGNCGSVATAAVIDEHTAQRTLELLESVKHWFDETGGLQYLSVLGVQLNKRGVQTLAAIFSAIGGSGALIFAYLEFKK